MKTRLIGSMADGWDAKTPTQAGMVLLRFDDPATTALGTGCMFS